MKMFVVVALALVALASAAPANDPFVETLRSNFDQSLDGAYNYGYETANGIVRNEQGELKEALDEDNKPHPVVVVRGTFTYTDPEGKVETISYIADENGYQPVGDSIPKLAARR